MILSRSASVNGAPADADARFFCSSLILKLCEAKYDVTPDLTGSSDFGNANAVASWLPRLGAPACRNNHKFKYFSPARQLLVEMLPGCSKC